MRTIAASQIFETACGLHGQPWNTSAGQDSLSLTDFKMLRPLLNNRLNAAWHLFPWPALVVLETRRRLEPIFDYAIQYALYQQVFDAVSNKCWFCVQVPPVSAGSPGDLPRYWAQLGDLPFQRTNDPNALFGVGDRVFNPQDSAIYYCFAAGSLFADILNPQRFAPLPEFNPGFPLDDSWQRPMEEVMGVWETPPSFLEGSDLGFTLLEDSVRVQFNPGSAWFRYRQACPDLRGDPWDEEASYAIDQQAYYTDALGNGDFWVCFTAAGPGEAPSTSPSTVPRWRKIEIPYIFGRYLPAALHADWYENDGQSDKAAGAMAAANECIQLELDKIERQQRQTEPWTVTTRR